MPGFPPPARDAHFGSLGRSGAGPCEMNSKSFLYFGHFKIVPKVRDIL